MALSGVFTTSDDAIITATVTNFCKITGLGLTKTYELINSGEFDGQPSNEWKYQTGGHRRNDRRAGLSRQ
jgi:hypothetical protein